MAEKFLYSETFDNDTRHVLIIYSNEVPKKIRIAKPFVFQRNERSAGERKVTDNVYMNTY